MRNNLHHLQQGFVYLWAMFAVTIAGVVLAGTSQTWQVKIQREKEQELLFIGEEFRNAFMSYYDSSPGNPKEYPDTLEELLQDTRGPVMKRHLRKVYTDPMTMEEDWGLVEESPPEESSGMGSNVKGGIVGVYSLSNKKPIKKENFPEHFAGFSEAETYQDWAFAFTQDGGPGQTQQTEQNQQQSGGKPSSSASPFGSPSQSQSQSSSTSPFSSQSSSTSSSSSPFATP